VQLFLNSAVGVDEFKIYKTKILPSVCDQKSQQKFVNCELCIQVGAAWDKNLLGQCTDFIIVSGVDVVSYLYINFVVWYEIYEGMKYKYRWSISFVCLGWKSTT
jgi:hypothetical protein